MEQIKEHIGADCSIVFGMTETNCKASIARHKVPKFFRFIESFPLTASGKVKKFVLRDQLIRELGLENVAGMKTA